ncbi:MAG: hypothetical protein RL030_677 [Pseudomonadota bacterium]|jgi:hypothetical protein
MLAGKRVEKGTRNGYSAGASKPALVFKRRDFARWQAREKLPDFALCEAVKEMECGLVDASLGGLLYKKRVARVGGGKSGGYRTMLSARIGSRYVFLHGYAKSSKANVSEVERKALQVGVLLEIGCGEQNH